MKIKINELSGAALDWAVGIAEGETMYVSASIGGKCARRLGNDGDTRVYYSPSTSWCVGGPLIESNSINLLDRSQWPAPGVPPTVREWRASLESDTGYWGFEIGSFSGPTQLIAAMRAIVAGKLGEEIEVPEELIP